MSIKFLFLTSMYLQNIAQNVNIDPYKVSIWVLLNF